MNKELKEDDRAIKISMPLLTEKEMLEIDNNFNEIVNKIKNQFIKEKDLAIAQYIINKQQKELEQKESILDKVTEFIKDDVTAEDIKFEGSKVFHFIYKKLINITKEKIADGINSYKDKIEDIIEGEKK